ncbi:MAG: HYR domain-containing protein [Chloroflexi bacterium]|nr:HYR domain-containing protein [Chloroflexota bacterium]
MKTANLMRFCLLALIAGSSGPPACAQAVAELDFGDAPDPSFPTLIEHNGARHVLLQGFHLGRAADAEVNGQPDSNALADDLAPAAVDDEDGVAFKTALAPGQPAAVEVVASGLGKLNAWVDFNGNGTWADAGEQIFRDAPLNTGTNLLNFPVPALAKPGFTFARFRFNKQGGLEFAGPASDGEVEDYRVEVQQPVTQEADFGDAPDPTYPTLIKNNGARHLILPALHLGPTIDGETDGQATATALGDDVTPSPTADDEDGVSFTSPLAPGQVATVEVIVSGAGRLDAWIDFNGNGSWSDEGDQIFTNAPVSLGVNNLSFTVPASTKARTTFARFRLSRQGGLGFAGPAPDGEVEDYQVSIEEPRDPCRDQTHRGTDFWLTFPANYAPDPANPVRLSLSITGLGGTTGLVTIPGLGFSTNFVIPPSTEIVIPLPKEADLGAANDWVENKGIHVAASVPVAVFGLNHVRFTTDGYLGLPSDVLGRAYIVQGYKNVHADVPELDGTQFALVACETNTDVTITPKVTVGSRAAGVPYTITLQRGETYQLRSTNAAPSDLSGTFIQASKPIAVFGSHQCANIPAGDAFFCDHIVEQLVPLQFWGVNFVALPIQTRLNGDTYRCLAALDGTTVQVNGVTVATLDRGQTHQFIRAIPVQITADKPIFVAQYANSSDFDGVTEADPFMLTIPSTSLFLPDQIVSTAPAGFPTNFISVIAPNAAVGVVQLDGAVLPAALFTPIGVSGYAGARVPVPVGPHRCSAPLPIGVAVYGFNTYDSYAWPGGLFFGDIVPPIVTCPVGSVRTNLTQTVAGGCTVAVPDFTAGVTVRDNCPLPQLVRITQIPEPGTRVSAGIHVVTLGARDAAGNLGTCTVILTVVDTTPLTLICPTNVVMQCAGPEGKRVAFNVVARNGCGDPVPVECTPPSGSLFPRGTTEVTCVATNNNGVSQSCSFTVTVTCETISIATTGDGQVVLTWSPTARLLTASDLDGTWIEVPNAVSPFAVSITARRQFFRVQE